MAREFTLGLSERLKSRKLIEQLFNEGKKLTVAPFRIYYLYNAATQVPLQFGVGVSNKNFKKATDRNRIKRITKEAWRLQKEPLQQKMKEQNKGLNVFFIYTGKVLPIYKDVYDSIGKGIDRLLQL